MLIGIFPGFVIVDKISWKLSGWFWWIVWEDSAVDKLYIMYVLRHKQLLHWSLP